MTKYQKLFPPELRTASIVPRWSIVWTLNKDTVANHSYFVAFYARQIAKLVGWKGDYGDLMYYALVHDLDETITGDIVSPVKKEIVDSIKSKAYVDTHMSVSMPNVLADTGSIQEIEGIKRIVKAADTLDALLFLITEKRLGNSIIEPRIEDAKTKFESAWFGLPCSFETCVQTEQVMIAEISWHEDKGGSGVG